MEWWVISLLVVGAILVIVVLGFLITFALVGYRFMKGLDEAFGMGTMPFWRRRK